MTKKDRVRFRTHKNAGQSAGQGVGQKASQDASQNEASSEASQGEKSSALALARFSLIYESRDLQLCVFEDAQGHLTAVRSSRLV